MSTSVLPQLLAVDSELSEQTVALETQLTELKEKRKGIQTVIAMFESGSTPAVADVVAATTAVSQPKSTAKKATKSTKSAATKTAAKPKTTKAASKAASKASSTKASSTKASSTKASSTKASSTKASSTKPAAKKATKAAAKPAAKRGRPTKAKPAAAATTAKEKATSTKRSGRTANWQRYVQENYRKSPLPDVIVGVLQAQPTNVFKIADVMNAVFKEDMPKSHFLKARNRISNILSAGARDGVWYRGRGGTYSMSEKSIKAS